MKAKASDRMDGLGSLVVQRTGLHIPQIPVHAVLHRVSWALEARGIPRLAVSTPMREEAIASAGFCGRYRGVHV